MDAWVNLPYLEVAIELPTLAVWTTLFFHGLKLPTLAVSWPLLLGAEKRLWNCQDWQFESTKIKCGSNCQGRQFYGHFFKLPNIAGLPKCRGCYWWWWCVSCRPILLFSFGPNLNNKANICCIHQSIGAKLFSSSIFSSSCSAPPTTPPGS